MGRSDPHRIDTPSALRARIGEPNPATRQKVFDRLDAQMTAFLARSPLCLLSTRDADGTLEVSPKGDRPGFTLAENEKTLLIPDRKGNKLLFGLQNILANPQVGLIFLLPGTDETLRVSGRAELRTDPDLPHRCRSGRPRRRRASLAEKACQSSSSALVLLCVLGSSLRILFFIYPATRSTSATARAASPNRLTVAAKARLAPRWAASASIAATAVPIASGEASGDRERPRPRASTRSATPGWSRPMGRHSIGTPAPAPAHTVP